MEKFTALGLSKGLTDVLKRFNFRKPSEIQEKAIPLALAGKDIIGGSATGSGKTLAFASPIIENLKPGKKIQALILTPTRELAEQVANSIRDFSINKRLNVLAIYGGVNIGTQTRQFSSTDVLVGTPGRILDHLSRRTLRLDSVKILILDEVDRMFDMGFRKDVEKIINECPKERQTMMFSATVSPDIDYLAKKYTKNPIEISVESFVDPTKLEQFYYDVPDSKKFSLLVHLLKQDASNLALVFCGTRRNVDFVANNLINAGIKAKAIHGGLEQKKRLRILNEFKEKNAGVLVCTDVAARGLHIEGISHVYNYDVANEAKDYIHRIGRTARAGKAGKAITILASRDYEKFGTLMRSDEIKIAPIELPQIEMVRIQIEPQRRDSRFRGNQDRNNFSRKPGNNYRRGNSRYEKRENNNDKPRGRNPRNQQGSSNRNSFHGKPSSGRYSHKNNFRYSNKPRR